MRPASSSAQGADAADKDEDNAPQGAKDALDDRLRRDHRGHREVGHRPAARSGAAEHQERRAALRVRRTSAVAAGTEASQEATEALLQDVARKVLTNPDAPIGLADAFYQGGGGAAAALVRAALHVKGMPGRASQDQGFKELQDAMRVASSTSEQPRGVQGAAAGHGRRTDSRRRPGVGLHRRRGADAA